MNHYFFGLMIGALMATSSINAQMPILNVNGKKENKEVYLQSLDVRVDVTGNIASTKFTMTFKNRTGKILEGELLFPLPDGVTVSHYALDINGKMREAVPVEKAKATQVFEEIEQRRVDPGLLERVEGNNFRTRIYPIPSNGIRTISIAYEQELAVENGSLHYRLPMDYREAIDQFSLKAIVWQSKAKPKTDGGLSGGLVFDEQGNNFVATFSRKNYQPSRSLAFSLPVMSDIPQVVMQSASGSYYFMASGFPKTEIRKKVWSDHLGIVWDASLSGLQRDIQSELELLDLIIREKKDLTISLFLLNNRFIDGGTYKISNGDWSGLQKKIESLDYDGGTDYSAIDLDKISSGEFLLFSDGLSTLSDGDFLIPGFTRRKIQPERPMELDLRRSNTGRPIHCIVSSPKADYSTLKWIAAQTRGKFINLNALSQEEMRNAVINETLHFLGIEKPASVREVYPSVATPVHGHFSVAGILDARQAEITLLFGYGSKVETRMKVKLQSGDALTQGNVYRVWAQKKINELDLCYEKNKEELTAIGQQFGIVTRNTSLIVLETLQDYITYNIVPPAELHSEYLRWKKMQDDEISAREGSLLSAAVNAAENLKQWWEKDFTQQKPKYPQPDKNIAPPSSPPVVMSVSDDMLILDVVEYEAMEEVSAPVLARQRSVQAASVMQSERRADKKEKELTRESKFSQPQIRLVPLKQDKEYTKTLTGKVEADYAIYLKIRPEYIHTPTFYFDMADWFFSLNDREKAFRILTSIADLDIENASLFRLLGYRFKEYGAYDLEAFVCKKVIQWRPMEPQSYRDHALALADGGKNQEALEALYSVLTQSYNRNINTRSAGIEEVVVTELNRLAAKNRLDISGIDGRLIKAMPVDIRVVMNWNMNNTDIDLHVKDPNGETCYYSHRQTAIGGRISQDITQGYGPEQFLLKKAVKGTYEVFVNYFGDSQVKAEGPSTIMLEIFTHYSGNREERKVVCLQMSKEMKRSASGLVKVAEFEF
ncbi:MAG: DUF2135 domain-containing protein [Bacteroidales bacterium]|nr:DUF2135 domain-containing protein [Bacteroidales bacterium]